MTGPHRTASYVLSTWVRTNAISARIRSPTLPTIFWEDKHEYDEHGAVCHGADGRIENRVGGNFYPRIQRLSKGVTFLSDSQLYQCQQQNSVERDAGFGTRHNSYEL